MLAGRLLDRPEVSLPGREGKKRKEASLMAPWNSMPYRGGDSPIIPGFNVLLQ